MATRATKATTPKPRPRRTVTPGAGKVSGNALTPAEPVDVDSLSGEPLGAEALSIRQRNAARLLAVGMSQQQAADAVGVDVRTVRRWRDEQAFEDMVQELHLTAWSRIEHAVMATLEQAIGVVQEMLRGEIKPDDKRYLAAERLIERLLTRLFAIGGTEAAAPHAELPAAPRVGDASTHSETITDLGAA